MVEGLLIVVVVLLVVVAIMQALALRRKVAVDLSPVQTSYERVERAVRDEIAKNREEASSVSRQSREELSRTLKGFGDTLNQQFAALRHRQIINVTTWPLYVG